MMLAWSSKNDFLATSGVPFILAKLIIIWQFDPVNFCNGEFGIKKLLTIINIMMVIIFIIMGVSLH